MSSTTGVEDIIIDAVSIVRLTRLCQLLPCVVMVYDHLITFDQEIEFIWVDRTQSHFQNKPRSISTVLYIMIRYLGGAMGISGWEGSALVYLIQIALQMRIYALYHSSRKVLVFMGVGFLVEVGSSAAILALAKAHAVVSNQLIPGIMFCSAGDMRTFLYAWWIPLVVFEGSLCAMAVWAGVKHFHSRVQFAGFSGERALGVLVKGSTLNFLCFMPAFIVNAVMWRSLPQSWLEIPEGFVLCIKVVVSCRMVLSLRKVFSQSSQRETLLTPMEFACSNS
ncbi:hypothetical protein BV22DRAFT_1044206 [Leucogyrophana mollusca]|uniref:Uncharacterized protein n=1 Tax=Leucogyrophana mollusca TaxID=85980 RepID=A0ACB8BUL1_9AGAM|nr:hypothetical protein BV22DRAFT_1044206 [Leucogyrophana mollusca]